MKIKIEGERVYSVLEIAIICNVCEATVRSWIKNGKLRLGHSVTTQSWVVKGYELRSFLRDNPDYNWRDDTIAISDDLKIKYLLAAKTKCMREISAAETALRNEMTELNEILKELFEEES